jgi:hypothetical protein
MPDTFQRFGGYTGAFAITPNDSVDLPQITCAIRAGTTGTISAVMMDGSSITMTLTGNDPSFAPLRIRRVLATGTTATGIFGLIN